jgi:hypothetical protein
VWHEVVIRRRKKERNFSYLVAHDQNVLLAFQLHNDGLQADDDVSITLAAAVAIVKLIVVSLRVIFRVMFLCIIKSS